MPKPLDPSTLSKRLKNVRAIRNPFTRVVRLCKLALRAGPLHAEPAIIEAIKVAAELDQPEFRDVSRDFVVDTLNELGNHAMAINVVAKMEGAFSRACAYVNVRQSSRERGEANFEKLADIGIETAREQLDSDTRADLERYIRLIED